MTREINLWNRVSRRCSRLLLENLSTFNAAQAVLYIPKPHSLVILERRTCNILLDDGRYCNKAHI